MNIPVQQVTASDSVSDDRRFGQAMILYAICFALVILVGGPLQAVSLKIGLPVTLLLLILTPAVIFTKWKKVPVAEGLRLRLRAVSPAMVPLSLLYGVGGLGLGILLAKGLQKIGMGAVPTGLSGEMDSLGAFLITLLTASVLPGICEESLFRGAIQGVLERRGKWFGLIVTAILFGLFHMDPLRVIVATMLGLIYGWLTVRTGSIIPSMLAHFANNATTLSISYFLDGYDNVPGWVIPSQLALLIVAGFLIFAMSKAKQSSLVDSPLTTVPAGLSPLVAWGCGIPSVLSISGIVAGMLLLAQLLTTVELPDGSQALMIERDSAIYNLSEGQRFMFEQDGQSVVGKADDVTDDSVSMKLKDGTEVVVGRDELKGMVVHVFEAN